MDDRKPWDRIEGEPNRWYDRFEQYRLMGSSRSVLACENEARQQANKSKKRLTSGAWASASHRWHWKDRAEAWDAHRRERARAVSEEAFLLLCEGAAENAQSLLQAAKSPVPREQLTAITEVLDRGGVPRLTKVAPTTPDGTNEYGGLSDSELVGELAKAVALALGQAGHSVSLPLDPPREGDADRAGG